MPLQVPCPTCLRKLSIPEEHAGKRVKCPSCGAVFTAAAPAPPPPASAVPPLAAPPPAPPPSVAPAPPPEAPASSDGYDVVDEEPKQNAEKRSVVRCPRCKKRYDPGIDVEGTLAGMPGNVSLKVVCPGCGQWLRLPEREMIDALAASPEMLRDMKAQARLLEEVDTAESPSRRRQEDDELPDDVEDAPRPRRKKKWRRSDVRALVSYPATALKIVAYIGAALTIILTIIEFGILLKNLGSPQPSFGPPRPGVPPGSESYRIGSIIGLILRVPVTLLWSKYLISAAESLECLQDYTKIILACAIAMLPCSLGCCGGIPVGIWIIVLMCLPDVRKAFSS